MTGMPDRRRPGAAQNATQDGTPGALIILLLAASTLTASALTRVMDALIPPISADFGATVGEFGFVLAAFAISYAAFQPLFGALADRFGKLEVVAAAAIAGGAATAMCGLADTVGALSLWRAATGAAVAPIVALCVAYVGEKSSAEDRQPTISRLMSGVMLGQVMAAAFAGVIVELAGWRSAFLGLALVAVACGASLLIGLKTGRIAPSTRSARYDPMSSFRMLARPNVRRVLGLTGLEGAAFFAAAGFVGAMLSHRFGLGYGSIGLLLAGYGIGGLIYVLSARRLHRDLGDRRAVMLGGGLTSLSYALITVVPSPAAVFVLLIFIGFGFYLMHTVLQSNATEMAPEVRGAALANFSLFMFVGQSLSAPVMGLAIVRFGFTPTFLAAAAGVALLTASFLRGLRTGAFAPDGPGGTGA